MTQLSTIGKALYGSRWQTELARAIGVSDRTVRRWLAGDPIPAEVFDKVRILCAQRIAELRKLSTTIKGAKR